MMLQKILQRFWAIAGAVSVRAKILGIVLGFILLLGVGVTIQARYALTATMTAQLDEQSVSVSRDLAARAADPILLNNLLGLHDLLDETLANNPNVRYAFFVDPQGQVIAHTFDGGFPLDLIALNSAATGEHHHTALIQTNEGLVWDTAVPILDGKIGAARIGLSDASMQSAVSTLTAQLLLTILLVSAAGILVAVFLTWILTRPIMGLVTTTQAVAKGDFSRRVPRWANDEIGDLATAFNAMTEELAHTDELRREREVLRRQLLEKVIATQEDERRRIARELHDSTSQSLTSLIVGLRLMETNCAQCASPTKATDLRQVASKTLDEVHELSMRLRPRVLDDLGLAAALERLAHEWQARYKIPVDVVIQLEERLPGELETALYRIVQETLTNIVRHAQAKSASILIEKHGNTVRAIVEDDGLGFDPTAQRGERHLGLLGMRERAELLNGTLTIESTPQRGTSVFIEIPIAAVTRDASPSRPLAI
ncbi:MAG: ATPase [Anaerolineae bacterium CG03_land_8_20_14_0_80_58_20]|nr:MAG: ATPase [Anaerolineae bacterium CG1_02_58_13]PIV25870.1 MAG: ATPase [Anaerolineae bacterium CG03_land_8_20_14_0_80_58_20]